MCGGSGGTENKKEIQYNLKVIYLYGMHRKYMKKMYLGTHVLTYHRQVNHHIASL